MCSAIAAFIGDFVGANLDESTTHFWLIGVIALAEISLGIGIWIESPKNKKVREWVGVITVLAGCIISAGATVSLVVFDEGMSRKQKAEIIALRKNSLPRSIDVSAFSEYLANAPPTRVEIRYVAACSDCESLSFELSEALKTAKWPIDPPVPIAPENRDWVRAVRSLHAQSAGITVVIDSSKKITADPNTSLGALNRALEQALGFSFSGYDVTVQGGVDVTMPPDVIRLVIAPKA